MRILPNHLVRLLCCAALLTTTAGSATKVHVITFGKWTSAQWFAGGTNDKAVIIKIRALVIDGRVKEYVLGAPHEVTDRLFVVRRVFRVNDSLPEDTAPRWSGNAEVGCWWTARRGTFRRLICRSSTLITRRPVGTATMLPIVELPTTEKRPMRWWRN